jgi:plastocyanin
MKLRFLAAGLAGLAAACSGSPGTGDSDNDGPPANTDIEIARNAASLGSNAFTPANLSISLAAQTTVMWWNGDFVQSGGYGGPSGVTHRLASDDGLTFLSNHVPPDGVFVATLSAPGTYAYHCALHPAMTGTITVTP